MIYVGFLLQAMGSDYFPRLTEVIRDRAAARQLVNDQLQLTMALGGPLLLVLIGCAPWLIQLLYSPEFAPAATILQWQTLGNFIKLASWPRGFLFVAAAQGRIFLWLQIQFNLIFGELVIVGLPVFGLEVTGIAFLISYVASFGVSGIVARKMHGFRWEPLSIKIISTYMVLALGLFILARAAPLAGAGASILLAPVTALVGGRIVLTKIGTHGRLVSKVARVYKIIGWPVKGKA